MQKHSEMLGMKVSGNIVSELSDRIPNNFMAFSELIKNAYDADASSIVIEVDSIKKSITIQDTGKGMSRNGIENLLHIARSNKGYATKRDNGRITQGEKGLGALATFHFGNMVTWETSPNGRVAYRFTVDKSAIITTDDISTYETTIEELPASFVGTKITITGAQSDDFSFMVETLNNKKTTTKLVRSLYDSGGVDEIETEIYVDGRSVIEKDDLIIDKSNNREKIYSVRYSSAEKNVYFYYNDTLVTYVPFVLDVLLGEFEITCDLHIFDLGGKVRNSDFPALYHKEQETDDITPLVYINQGFFKNYNLFNVDRVRQIDSGSVLAQMTGEIEIKTQSPRLMFNADRTEINENSLTAKLKNEIERLNVLIQRTGAKYKYPFIALNRGNCPFLDSDNPNRRILKRKELDITGLDAGAIERLVRNNISNRVFAELVSYEIGVEGVTYSFFHEEIVISFVKQEVFDERQKPNEVTDKPREGVIFQPATIKLKHNKIEKTIGRDGQINLYDYIEKDKTLNSVGEPIDFEDIEISDDKGLMRVPNILPAIAAPQSIAINYKYDDKNTGITSSTLMIIFASRPNIAIKGKIGPVDVIHTHGIGNFEITFDTVASRLVNQINSLDSNEYVEMIACSLRTLFELGVDSIRNRNTTSTELKRLQSTIVSRDLEKNVKLIVEFVKDNVNRGRIRDYLNESFSNVSFHTLKNIANPARIARHASESNLGAHKGTKNLTKEQVFQIAHDVSAYLILVEGIIGAFGS